MLQNAVFCDDIQKKTSASGGVAPRPLPGALPLDPTGGLLRPPDPRIIFLLFHFSPVSCLLEELLNLPEASINQSRNAFRFRDIAVTVILFADWSVKSAIE